MRARTLRLAPLVGVLGCQIYGYGPTPETFRPAQSPFGITAEVRLSTGTLTGELLAVDADGMLLLADERVVRVSWDSQRGTRFRDFQRSVPPRRAPETRVLQEIAALSRHPFGLTTEQWSRLLEQYGQSAPEEVRP